MDEIVDRKHLRAFLADLKRQLESGVIHVEDRDKNTQALVDLNIKARDRKTYIKKLKEEDYSEGPRADEVRKGWVYYVFGIRINGVEVYIKITRKDAVTDAWCLSFHPAEHPMHFPLKQQNDERSSHG